MRRHTFDDSIELQLVVDVPLLLLQVDWTCIVLVYVFWASSGAGSLDVRFTALMVKVALWVSRV